MIDHNDSKTTPLSSFEASAFGRASRGGGFSFGCYSFYPEVQTLFENGRELKLGSRASAILSELIKQAGNVVSKETLLRVAWPFAVVDEGNLRVHIAAIRKALGDGSDKSDFIVNIVGRGYQFIAPFRYLKEDDRLRSEQSPNSIVATMGALPTGLMRIFGRDDAVEKVVQLSRDQRLVSIIGPGGIGKTTVALAAAQRLRDEFVQDTHFVDLSTVSDLDVVPFAIAAALNFAIETNNPIGSLVSHLKHSKVLIILDNCEHVIDAAANVVEAILKGAHALRVLATSHEPLRADGERLFHLLPLEFPDDRDDLTLEQAVRYSSVELFVERASSNDRSLVLTDFDVPFIIEICSKLDGIPLAIEMAAAQLEVFGIIGIAEHLEDRLDVLTVGRRTAVRRHQTIRSMLDWSHENLLPSEQVVLRRLGVFTGSFTLEAAEMVTGDENLTPSAITSGVASLFGKSLLHSKRTLHTMNFRLLESTKLYALEKLVDAGEAVRARHLHVQYVIEMLERAEVEWTDTTRSIWLDRYSTLLDDVRSALTWAFSPDGDVASGVRLSSLAMPLGLQLGLVDEFRERAETALAQVAALTTPELLAEMRLNIVSGVLSANQTLLGDDTIVGLTRACHLAELIGLDRHRLEPRILLAAVSMGMGSYDEAISHAEYGEELGKRIGDDLAVVASQRILSQVLHFNGEHRRAVRLAKKVLAHPVVNIPVAFGNVQTDRRVSMRIVIARALWMEGKADQAVTILREAIAIAPEDGPLALCQALALAACPVLLWRGDVEGASDAVQTLLEESNRFALKHWHSWGLLFQALLAPRKEEDPLGDMQLKPEGGLQIQTLATLNGRLIGLDPEALSENGWCGPEILRVRGEYALRSGEVGAAELTFRRSIALAQNHDALAWELRGTISLTRLLIEQRRHGEAKAALSSVYSRFTEGFDTFDLKQAKQLLGELSIE